MIEAGAPDFHGITTRHAVVVEASGDLEQNWLLPTDLGTFLRDRTTHEQNTKDQRQAHRRRKRKNVKICQRQCLLVTRSAKNSHSHSTGQDRITVVVQEKCLSARQHTVDRTVQRVELNSKNSRDLPTPGSPITATICP